MIADKMFNKQSFVLPKSQQSSGGGYKTVMIFLRVLTIYLPVFC
jgi:hypothetical protein